MYGCTAHQTCYVQVGYHFVWCPKYRKKILVGKLATFIEQEIRRICEDHTWTTRGGERPARSRASVSRRSPVRGSLRYRSSVERCYCPFVFQRFPGVKRQLWGGAFWSRSYYVGSVGDISVDTVLKYIELGQD